VNLTLTAAQLVIIISQAIVVGFLDIGDHQQRIFDHRWNAVKFSDIYYDILSQFSMPVSKRCNDDEFIKSKTKEYNDTLLTAPPIRPTTLSRYIEETKNSNIFKPVVVGGFNRIDVVIDSHGGTGETGTDASPEEIKNNISSKINLEIDRWLKNG